MILDVRSREEFAAAHIPGAVNIPHDQLTERIDRLPLAKSDEVVVHCERGGRAAVAEKILTDAGYTHVRDLKGQMQVWQANGLPIE